MVASVSGWLEVGASLGGLVVDGKKDKMGRKKVEHRWLFVYKGSQCLFVDALKVCFDPNSDQQYLPFVYILSQPTSL